MTHKILKYSALLTFSAAIIGFSSCAKDETIAPTTPSDESPQIEQPQGELTGELLVKFSPYVGDVIEQTVGAQLTRSGAATRSGLPSVDEVLTTIEAYQLERLFPIDPRHEERTRESELHLWYIVRFSDDHTLADVEKQLSRLGEVETTERNQLLKRTAAQSKRPTPISVEQLAQMKGAATRSNAPMNDPLLTQQWHLINDGSLSEGKAIAGADLGAEQAWLKSTGDPSIIVAVLDEGVDLTHEDLINSLWINDGESYASKSDNDGNGYRGDAYGYNFVSDEPIISWTHAMDTGHGTHVAGTVAARNGNDLGVSSIAGGSETQEGVKIMTCQIFAGNRAATTAGYVRAVKYATDNGAVILQVSSGYNSGLANPNFYAPGFGSEDEWIAALPLERKALDYFINNAGSPNGTIDGGIPVYAAGNEEAAMAGFPSGGKGIIAVAATAADYTPTDYTNYGVGVDIAAPGGDIDYYYNIADSNSELTPEHGAILSTVPTEISPSGYAFMEGTSMACPNASGTIALAASYARQLRKHFKAEELIEMMKSSAVQLDDKLSGTKTIATFDGSTLMQMNLSNYRGKMGAGQINAAALLSMVESGGVQLSFPNLYIATGKSVTTTPGDFFVGAPSTFTVSIANSDVASYQTEGGNVIFKGLKGGSTKASITSGSTTHDFVITVRDNAADNGWM